MTRHSAGLVETRSSYRWAEAPGNFDLLNCRALYSSSNRLGIPDMSSTQFVPDSLVAYNESAVARPRNRPLSGAAIHFFLDDYRFETVWTKPERALSRLARVGAALTPDFSMWRDMPRAMQIWQVYRSRWCGRWLADHGIEVVPTISWSLADSYPYAFVGIERGSVLAVATVGLRRPEDRALFANGYREMVRRLAPSTVLVYGAVPLPGDVAELAPVRMYKTRWQEIKGRGSEDHD